MHNVPLGDYHIYLNASNQTKIKKKKIKLKIWVWIYRKQKTEEKGEKKF